MNAKRAIMVFAAFFLFGINAYAELPKVEYGVYKFVKLDDRNPGVVPYSAKTIDGFKNNEYHIFPRYYKKKDPDYPKSCNKNVRYTIKKPSWGKGSYANYENEIIADFNVYCGKERIASFEVTKDKDLVLFANDYYFFFRKS